MVIPARNDLANIAGTLDKKRRIWRFWNKTYLILDGIYLSSHVEKGYKPSWTRSILRAAIQGTPSERRIVISCRGEREIQLRANSQQQYVEWLRCLMHNASHVIENDYSIGPNIGSGAFGEVYKAYDRRSKMSRKEAEAVKSIKKTKDGTSASGSKEIRIVRTVEHKNIVQTRGIYEDKEHFHIVMELVDGGNLSNVAVKMWPLDEKVVRQAMKQILEGVAYLHDMHIVHRDLKLSNILCATEILPCDLKITDFGLSDFIGKGSLRGNVESPHYAAPEICNAMPYDERVDCWALGVVLYKLLSGEYPYNAREERNLPRVIFSTPLRFGGRLWRRRSELAKDLVKKLMEKNVAKRISVRAAMKHAWFSES